MEVDPSRFDSCRSWASNQYCVENSAVMTVSSSLIGGKESSTRDQDAGAGSAGALPVLTRNAMRADLCSPDLLSRLGRFSASECVGRYSCVCLCWSARLCARIDAPSICDCCLADAEADAAGCATAVGSGGSRGSGVTVPEADFCDRIVVDVSADFSVTAVSFVAEGVSVT